MSIFEMIKSAFASPKDMSKAGIGSLTDACSHYRSNKGGLVKANPYLYQEMKADSSFKNFVNEMTNILTNKVKNAKVGDVIQNAPNSNRGLKCTTMGAYKLNIEYKHKVAAGMNNINLHLFGLDLWDFEPSDDKGWFRNLTTETIPGLVAGKGTPFDITYDFNYSIQIKK